jgi:hypothetical protein
MSILKVLAVSICWMTPACNLTAQNATPGVPVPDAKVEIRR